MSVVYFHQPEELAPGLKTPIDDDSTNWWAGAQRCFAAAAAAAVLAGSTFAAVLDRNLQRQTDDMVPQPVAQAVDEDYWQNCAPPLPASLWQPLPIDFDAGELAPGLVSTAFDDDALSAQTRVSVPQVLSSQPRAAALQFADDDLPQFTAQAFTPDEDALVVSAQPKATALQLSQPRAAALQFADDDLPQFTAPTFTPDEDYLETRQCRVSTLVSWTAPVQQDEGAAVVPAAFEEDALPRVVIWMTLDRRDATLSRLCLGGSADLSRSSGPILARGVVTAAPAHPLAVSAAVEHTAAESCTAAHICVARTVSAHSLTPGATPAHTLTAEVMI
ncbi:MAG TPA: hypothetical protein VF532_05860 [Candidatus Angelobacter sp.]